MSKSKYVGKWIEDDQKEITYSYKAENLRLLLELVVKGNLGEITHQDIANWCDCYYLIENDHVKNDDICNMKVLKIVQDISIQWELMLANSFSLEELKNLDFSKVEMPFEWFEKWLGNLKHVFEES